MNDDSRAICCGTAEDHWATAGILAMVGNPAVDPGIKRIKRKTAGAQDLIMKSSCVESGAKLLFGSGVYLQGANNKETVSLLLPSGGENPKLEMTDQSGKQSAIVPSEK